MEVTAETRRLNRVKSNNSVNVLYPYRTKYGGWVYDDEDLGIYAEAFVMGSSEVIDYLVGKDCNECKVTISSEPLPMFQAHLVKIEAPSGYAGVKGWYQMQGTGMEHWLCSRVLDYFPDYPENIYVQIEKL